MYHAMNMPTNVVSGVALQTNSPAALRSAPIPALSSDGFRAQGVELGEQRRQGVLA